MPVTKSAKKKLRQDVKRSAENKKLKENLKKLLKDAKKNVSEKAVKEAIQAADKAVKKGIIHANKAARIKSQFAKKAGIGTQSPSIKASPKKRTTVKKK